jgi:AcrR family transcriptional regulator
MSAKALAPKQDRSRETSRRLLKATVETLAEKGLDGCTIPRIAAKAGLSPGTVYRRYPDKDALLQAAVLAVLAGNEKGVKALVSSEEIQKMDLKTFVEFLVGKSVENQRTHSALVREARQFVLSHKNARFRKKADELEVRTFRLVTEFMIARRNQIKHPDPSYAMPFALMVMSFALMHIIILDSNSGDWASLLPLDDEMLSRELTRLMLAYWDTDQKKTK